MVQTFCEFNQLTEQMMISTYASFEATFRVVILGSEFKMKASLVIIIVWHTHSQTLREVSSCNSHFFSCALGHLCLFFFLYGCVTITSNKRIFFNRLFGNKTIFHVTMDVWRSARCSIEASFASPRRCSKSSWC